MMRYVNAHEPALLPQEAAMLTALPARTRPGNLLMPSNTASFVSVNAPVQAAAPVRRGSVAGRAVLRTAGITLPGPQPMSQGTRKVCIPKQLIMDNL